jgi:hypothetical protein
VTCLLGARFFCQLSQNPPSGVLGSSYATMSLDPHLLFYPGGYVCLFGHLHTPPISASPHSVPGSWPVGQAKENLKSQIWFLCSMTTPQMVLEKVDVAALLMLDINVVNLNNTCNISMPSVCDNVLLTPCCSVRLPRYSQFYNSADGSG